MWKYMGGFMVGGKGSGTVKGILYIVEMLSILIKVVFI